MLGVFVKISQPLLRLPIHEGRSFRTLFDPANKTKRPFLSIGGRVQLELLRSAWRISQRLSCPG
jgi:hypothetical protein